MILVKQLRSRARDVAAGCPLFLTAQLLGKRWMVLVLQELICYSAEGRRFSELHRVLSWVSPKILTRRLRELEECKVLTRSVDASTIPVNVRYHVTKKGLGLESLIEEMRDWGRKYNEEYLECHGSVMSDCIHCNKHDMDQLASE